MAIAHVQTPAGGVQNSSATSVNLAFGSNVTAGSLIVGGWRYSVGGETVTLSDTLGNTWTSNSVQVVVAGDGNSTQGVGFASGSAAGACTVTFAITGAAKNLRFSTSEYSVTAGAASVDQTITATGTSTTPASGAVTPTSDGQLFYCTCHTANGVTYTAGTDYTVNTTVPETDLAERLGTERFIQTTAASHDGTWSTTATPGAWGCVTVTFKEGAVVPPETVRPVSGPGRISPEGLVEAWAGVPATSEEAAPETSAPAEAAESTVTAETPSVDIVTNAAESAAAATAEAPAPSVAPNAEAALAGAAAEQPSTAVSPVAGTAAATATGEQPAASIAVNAEVAPVGAAALDATVSTANITNAPAETAAATVTAETPTVTISITAEVAAVTAAAEAPTTDVKVNAGLASVTGTAEQPAATVTTNADVAAVTAVAQPATPDVKTNAETAPVGAAALDATASTATFVNVNAQVADVAATANNATPAVAASPDVAATAATAETPAASIRVNAELGVVGAAANNPTVAFAKDVAAETAAVTATALNPTPAVGAGAVTALVTAEAANATVPAQFVIGEAVSTLAGGDTTGAVIDDISAVGTPVGADGSSSPVGPEADGELVGADAATSIVV